jgi:hypothetical protein
VKEEDVPTAVNHPITLSGSMCRTATREFDTNKLLIMPDIAQGNPSNEQGRKIE